MKKLIILLLLVISGLTFGKTLKLGTSSYPGVEMFNIIKDDLAAQGIELELIEMNDYVTPNLALADGAIDINSFQHIQYLNQFCKDKGLDLVSAGETYVVALGLYSEKYKSVDEIPAKSIIAIPNDPTNAGRALIMLHNAGIIKLEDPSNLLATEFDIVENPKKLKFKLIEAPQLPRVIKDVAACVINGGYAVEAGYIPTEDAILVEDVNKSPYVNIFTVRKGDENREDIKAFVKAYQSDKMKKYVLEKFKGGYIPTW